MTQHITNREKEVLEIVQRNKDVKKHGYNFFLVCYLATHGVHLEPEERQAVLDMPSIESLTRAFRKLVEKGEIVLDETQKRKRATKASQVRAEMSNRRKPLEMTTIYDEFGNSYNVPVNRGYYR